MMFSGAYDSHFYRSFRDLMHEQVDLLKPGPGMQPRQYCEACAALEARWAALMAGARDHRNPRAIAVASRKRPARSSPILAPPQDAWAGPPPPPPAPARAPGPPRPRHPGLGPPQWRAVSGAPPA